MKIDRNSKALAENEPGLIVDDRPAIEDAAVDYEPIEESIAVVIDPAAEKGQDDIEPITNAEADLNAIEPLQKYFQVT